MRCSCNHRVVTRPWCRPIRTYYMSRSPLQRPVRGSHFRSSAQQRQLNMQHTPLRLMGPFLTCSRDPNIPATVGVLQVGGIAQQKTLGGKPGHRTTDPAVVPGSTYAVLQSIHRTSPCSVLVHGTHAPTRTRVTFSLVVQNISLPQTTGYTWSAFDSSWSMLILCKVRRTTACQRTEMRMGSF